jgi:hypothetical protein
MSPVLAAEDEVLEIAPADVPQWHVDREAADPSVEAMVCNCCIIVW